MKQPQAAAGADRESVERWMTEHGGAVLRLAYAIVLDRGRAEDVFQDVFVKAHQHAYQLHDPTVRAWLLKTTANQCRDLRRSWWWRLLARGARLGGPDAEVEFARLADPSPQVDPAAVLAGRDRQEAVARAVWGLPEGYRETVALFYFEGLSALEVAQLLGVREGTVHSRLHRARELLREKLAEWRVEP